MTQVILSRHGLVDLQPELGRMKYPTVPSGASVVVPLTCGAPEERPCLWFLEGSMNLTVTSVAVVAGHPPAGQVLLADVPVSLGRCWSCNGGGEATCTPCAPFQRARAIQHRSTAGHASFLTCWRPRSHVCRTLAPAASRYGTRQAGQGDKRTRYRPVGTLQP